MPSRTSKPTRSQPPQPWKEETSCSEADLKQIALQWVQSLGPRDHVFLEGPMGAGKSTFARLVLEALGVEQSAEGSPTFALAHEYRGLRGEVIHLDCYRLRSEEELEAAGVLEYFWERRALVLAEWVSLFPELQESLMQGIRGVALWKVELGFQESSPNKRSLRITQLRKA
jgi:tRNA threonylcarbamoyladenosine biosynthesis protein TsaE